ncbi:hypothetical protein IEO21_02138 [Rhodonia placenta]|uniref:Cyclin N-terminal domain-containing protein n=1 Tax=Rhodonia placenta TaxID=104341 RepID=A0A8H7P859_9APHY|nr:hypothetical protein IEO21_02138 [Postia placenta]
MSSNIPTRRVTRATRTTILRDKENSTRNRTTTTRAKPPSTANAVENARPTGIARATTSTAATRAKSVAPPVSRVDPAPQKRKREALGEVPKPPENKAAKPANAGPGPSAVKGKDRVKDLKEKFEGVVLKKATTTTTTTATTASRRPLRTVGGTVAVPNSSTRRITRSSAVTQQQPQPQAQLEQVKEEEEVPESDHAMVVDLEPIVPVPSPKRFTAARRSAATAHQPVVRDSRTPRRSIPRPVIVRHEDDEETRRVFKKRRTSSDLPDEAAAAEVEEVVGFAGTPEADPEGPDWDDLDAGDADDPLMVSEYVVEIFDYLKEVEQTTLPNPNYMENQKDLAWKMRGILNDWLIQVHSRFKLLPETLFLCVNIIDRFLSARVVSLAKLQLVGVTCMFIAAKVEEIVAPSAKNFLYCADASYVENQILLAERYVLKTIDWNLSYPNPIHFLRRTSKADDYNIQVRTIAKYLMEIQCLEWRLIAAPPSLLSAAAIWFARIILGFLDWTPNLAHYSSYPEHALVPTANLMLNYVLRPIRHESFFKKYASKKFLKASIWVRQWALDKWDENTTVSLVDVLPELKALIREQNAELERQEAEAEAEAAAREDMRYYVDDRYQHGT